MIEHLQPAINEAYGIDSRDSRLLGGYYNHVFETSDGAMVIKCCRFDREDPAFVEAELAWMKQAAEAGLLVPEPVPAKDGGMTARLSEEWFVVVTKKLNGAAINPRDPEQWNERLFRQWGETMGTLRRSARHYAAAWAPPFLDWTDDRLVREALAPAGSGRLEEDAPVWDLWLECVQEARHIPQDPDRYGLIHHDLHPGNLLRVGDRLAVLDFGDSIRHWHAYDIAIASQAASMSVRNREERPAFVSRFLDAFAAGYAEADKLPAEEWERVPFFLRYRSIYSYLYHRTSKRPEEWSDQEQAILARMREDILSGAAYL
ncbi:MAG: phosphotransferase [Paenibacillus dendritiformis]|uniref:phosphotransferase enzyme family protein n=1 Tax=uncultured Paenibacillus sp. TaxID=227322 RepID=UPI0025D5F3BE|nr:phosphotransferase [uncultured Paenibacillus sp.]MDU5144154.1 phosphotransferase [Paenibacillus dendritiformis]